MTNADRSIRVLVSPDYAGAELLAVLVPLRALLEKRAVSLFFDQGDFAGARERLDAARQLAGITADAPIALCSIESPDVTFDVFGAFTNTRRGLAERLALPVVSNRWELEALCIDQGILPAGNDTFCPRPWHHLHVQADGLAAPCCIALPEGESLETHSLEQVFNGPGMRRVRLNMLRGVRDAVCHDCWEGEELGKLSLRQLSIQSMEECGHLDPPTRLTDEDRAHSKSIDEVIATARAATLDDGAIPADKIAPTSIDIRWSNVCNFKCRMCYHRASSSWFEDARRIADEIDAASGETSPERSARRWLVFGDKAIVSFNSRGQAIEKLTPYLNNLQSVYSAGGEPLMMEDHFTLLDQLGPRAAEVSLSYNTNLSHLDFRGRDLVDIWRPFKSVHLGVSVDGLGAVGEYVRTGFVTDKFLANLTRIRAACATNPRLTYSLAITISSYNVFHVAELLGELLAKGYVDSPDQLHLSIVHSPTYASPLVLPRALRERAATAYDKVLLGIDRKFLYQQVWIRAGRSNVALALRAADDGLFELNREQVWAWLERLDRLRSTSWRDVIPHMACFGRS